MELGLRLNDFYDMPFAEFIIMSYGFDKKIERETIGIQFIAWHSMIGSHLDPKKIPSFDKFINKKETGKRASEELKAVFFEEYQQYLNQVNK